MNAQDIPHHVKEIFNDRSMSMKKKMLAFMMFSTNLPNNPDTQDFNDLGVEINSLVNSGKIVLNGFDQDFVLNIQKLN